MSGNTKEETEQQFVSEAPVEEENGKKRTVFRGELALFITVMINSFGVVLMLYSGAGISAISSVPFAFSEVAPVISLGTWTYIFQADDHAQKICSGISVQLCGRICIQRAFGFA